MPLATERWTGRRLSGGVNGWRATRVFDVTDVSTDMDAKTAGGVPQTGESWPQNASLLVTNAETELTGPLSYAVTVTYETPDFGGGGGGTDDPNPLARPARIRWSNGSEIIPVDRDFGGHPIMNANGDGLDPPATKPFKYRILEIRRYEPFFDLARAEEFQNHVNSNEGLLGPFIIGVGQAYCSDIIPDEEFEVGAPYVRILYRFELKSTSLPQPWQFRHVHKGKRGYYLSGTTRQLGDFYYPDGTKITEDILLSAGGNPADNTIKVSPALVAGDSGPVPTGAELEFSTIGSQTVTFFRWNVIGEADFSQLTF